MRTVVDFHSHILPGIDDGSHSVAESLQMLHIEAQQGISRVIATPHFYARQDNLERFLERRQQSEQILYEAMRGISELPEILVGAEVRYFTGISDSDAVSALTIDGGNHILVEMPQGPWDEGMYRELERLYTKQGLTPIIAHIDRYIRPFRTCGIPKRLAELPVLIQANAEFFLNRNTTGMALRMLKKGQIHLLGSDCHNLKNRKPNLETAVDLISNHLGEDALAAIHSYEQIVLISESTCIQHTIV